MFPIAKCRWIFLVLLCTATFARADDWPTFRRDNHRGGRTSEQLPADKLHSQWTWQSPQPPQPAWAGPAKWDAYRNLKGLKSMRNYDPVFHPTASGDAIYFGSSVDDAVHCLDAATGMQRWLFFTDAPIRITPTIAGDKVYFGSDDGAAYCVRADNGKLVWQFRPAPNDRRILNNGRMISPWPVRTGVLVDGGTAYFAAGMLPWRKSWLCAVDAETGKPEGKGCYVAEHNGLTMEGAMLAADDRLFVPQGRVPPLMFDRATGKSLGSVQGGGGCFVILTEDEHLLHGPGNKTGWITDSNAQSRAKVASFAGGNAMVVDVDTAYLLTDTQLIAVNRKTRKPIWTVPCDCPYELILAGDTLFAGGRDRVAAFAAKDGTLLWEGDVRGKAFGLAVAGGRLLISTDEGAVHTFRPGTKPPPKSTAPAAERPAAEKPKSNASLEPVPPLDDKDLAGRWVFQGDRVARNKVKDLAGRLTGAIAGRAKLQRVGDRQALVTDGSTNSVLLAPDHKTANLPAEKITAEAWVRVDQPLKWGGIVGAVQDNGNYEKGWLLGYNGSRFSLALNGRGGPDRLTYMAAGADFKPGQWYHVVGTYDGAEMRLYVNGKLSATSTAQKGPIDYPPKAFYEIGAYHDKDEYFRLKGMIHEVRVWRRVLSADEVKRHHAAKPFGSSPAAEPQSALHLAMGPYLQFTDPTTAVVRWETEKPVPTIVEYGDGGDTRRVEDKTPKTRHEAMLTELRHNTLYHYTIHSGAGATTKEYECDTFFNYTPAAFPDRPCPYPKDARIVLPQLDEITPAQLAKDLLADEDKIGICLVFASGNGRLLYEIARQSDLRVIGVETDAAMVAESRKALSEAGIYGSRVAVHQVDSYAKLPFVDHFADVVFWAGLSPHRGTQPRVLYSRRPRRKGELGDDEIRRLMRPHDAGRGAWTHQYGRPDNSAYGGEALDGVGGTAKLTEQWLGRPGPRAQADRNGRKPSPLSVGGRLFMQGLHRIIAINAYNGTIAWSLEIPDFERFNIPRDCSNWCADDDHLYAAIRDRCWRIDTATGNVSKTYEVLPAAGKDWKWEWGYVARDGDQLFGSSVKQGTSWVNFFGGSGAGWYDARSGAVTDKICSDQLFAMDPATGKTNWTYRGLIVNPTITIGDGRVCFVECRNPKAVAGESRRIGADVWKDQFLVALDAKSGKKLWERPIDTADGTVVFYMAYGEGKLVIVSSDNKYHVYAFDAENGRPAWNVDVAWDGRDHGHHMTRPAILGGRVFVRPRVIDLTTGEIRKTPMPKGGCGTYALTDRAVIFRAGNVTMWDFVDNKTSSWSRLRPGCWLSTIPAAGMVLSPEAGGGCSCGKWMETSIGFVPKESEATK